MANEIEIGFQPDETNVFACVKNSSKQVAITSTGVFETWNDSNVATYAIDAAEAGGGGTFYADFPTTITTPNKYKIYAYQGAKDGSANYLGSGIIIWDGTAEVTISADIKAALEADGSKLDHLWETTEDDSGVRRFTENALEQAPTAEMDQNELHAALDAYIATGGDFDDIKKLLRADKVIDTAETPWVVDYKEEGTANVLMSKTMKNTDGESIGNVNNVLGRLKKET